jgi:hypothetical protein
MHILTPLEHNSLLPIENEKGLEKNYRQLYKRRQISIQNKGMLTTNLHNQGRGKHEVNKTWNGVVWREGCMGCAQRLIWRENTGSLDQSAYRKLSDWC